MANFDKLFAVPFIRFPVFLNQKMSQISALKKKEKRWRRMMELEATLAK